MSQELREYTTFYIIILFLMIGISLLIELLFQANLPSSTGFIGSAVAAMMAGQAFAKRQQSLPSPETTWRLGFVSLLVVLAITFALTAVSFIVFNATFGTSLLAGFEAIPLWIYGAGLLFFGALHVLGVRIFYPFGAKLALNSKAK